MNASDRVDVATQKEEIDDNISELCRHIGY